MQNRETLIQQLLQNPNGTIMHTKLGRKLLCYKALLQLNTGTFIIIIIAMNMQASTKLYQYIHWLWYRIG